MILQELKAVELLFLGPDNKQEPTEKPVKKRGARMSGRILAKRKAKEEADYRKGTAMHLFFMLLIC